MASKFVPLEFGLIDEGKFQEEVNIALQSVMRGLIAYKKKYGKEASHGAKATVSVKIHVKFEGRDESDFSIKGTIQETVPARPSSITVAIENEDQDSTPTLFVRRSGSSKDTPRQGIITTQDGELVDPETGEVMDKQKGEKKK